VADDLGWGDVGFHGGPVATPGLDRLAREGVELSRFYTFPTCVPTRAALMTGRSPSSIGLARNLRRTGLPLAEHLMPESFRAAGFQTWLIGKWHLGGQAEEVYLPTRRGFDSFYGFLGRPKEATRGGPRTLDWRRGENRVPEPPEVTAALVDELVARLAGRDRSRPFFAVLAFEAVHGPYDASLATLQRYEDVPDRTRGRYLAELDEMDRGVQRVLAALDEEAVAVSTIVLFLGDNGGSVQFASNAPLRGGKGTVLEGGIRTPAVLRWPDGIGARGRRRQVISVMDVLPTLATAAGVEVRAEGPLDGRDVWAALRDDAAVAREPVVIGNGDVAAIQGRWKLVRPAAGGSRLFDVEADPGERHDLADGHPELVESLGAAIDRARAASGAAGADTD
ncbi:MAG: sulfatase-like hydrolase/transferase, partial [Planctomycetota bacterium]